jgi:hypothetical protein
VHTSGVVFGLGFQYLVPPLPAVRRKGGREVKEGTGEQEGKAAVELYRKKKGKNSCK